MAGIGLVEKYSSSEKTCRRKLDKVVVVSPLERLGRKGRRESA